MGNGVLRGWSWFPTRMGQGGGLRERAPWVLPTMAPSFFLLPNLYNKINAEQKKIRPLSRD